MDGYQVSKSSGRGLMLPILFVVVQVSGLATVSSVLLWRLHYSPGFSWRSSPELEFSWHPLLLTSGLVVVFGNAAVLYRAPGSCLSKKTAKTLHATLLLVSLGLAAVGTLAVLDSHNLADPPIPNMFSLHSWLGATALGLFALQWMFGFLLFLVPSPSRLKARYHPIHTFFGNAILVLSASTALIGLTEEAIFSLPNYSNLPGKAVLINCIGIFISIFTLTVIYITTKSSFKKYS